MRRCILSDAEVDFSILGFGCSGLMGSGSSRERQALLECALDAGITHFDVARLYGLGCAESELGRFLKKHQGEVTVATKFGLDPMPLAVAAVSRISNRLGLKKLYRRLEGDTASRTHQFAPAQARSAMESSLKKLNVDVIDLYLLHDCSPEDVENPDLIEFLLRARSEGKIRAFGLATGIGSIITIERAQPEYSRVVQFQNSILTPQLDLLPPRASRLAITHRALSNNFSSLRQRLADAPEVCRSWSYELDVDLSDPAILANAMLAYATAANPHGVVLFSTTKQQRIEANARAVENPILDPERAMRFAHLVGGEK